MGLSCVAKILRLEIPETMAFFWNLQPRSQTLGSVGQPALKWVQGWVGGGGSRMETMPLPPPVKTPFFSKVFHPLLTGPTVESATKALGISLQYIWVSSTTTLAKAEIRSISFPMFDPDLLAAAESEERSARTL